MTQTTRELRLARLEREFEQALQDRNRIRQGGTLEEQAMAESNLDVARHLLNEEYKNGTKGFWGGKSVGIISSTPGNQK